MGRVMENSAPQDNHSYCRLFKELGFEMTGYGPSLFGNRLVRTRMLGGVGAGGEKPPATRLGIFSKINLLFDNVYPQGYSTLMVEIRKTELFAKWIDNLRDAQAKARVLIRIERLASGNAGDVKPVGEGISEMRIDYGPGYRVYFIKRGNELIILLAGGDKSSQTADIKVAIRLASNL